MWRTTQALPQLRLFPAISIHVPRVEDDLRSLICPSVHLYFNPRPPCGGRRPACSLHPRATRISIHVPRVEDDGGENGGVLSRVDFNPRPPCGGRQLREQPQDLPMTDFNPRPPCGGRLLQPRDISRRAGISIHVPRVEDDVASRICRRLPTEFQSTSPVWRTTAVTRMWCSSTGNFNPRPPCGGRRTRVIKPPRRSAFQSTSPVWRTTRFCGPQSDNASHFNPRPPCGGRPTTERKK